MDENRLEGAARSAFRKAEAAVGQMTGDAATEAKGRGRDAAGVTQKLYGRAVDAANDVGEAASGLAKQALDAGGDVYRQSNRAIARTIRHQPVGALVIAGAVGFTLALMLNRQPPRRRPRWADLRY